MRYETEAFLATRKEAAKAIDAATAEVSWDWGQVLDPYGVDSEMPDEYDCLRPADVEAGGYDEWPIARSALLAPGGTSPQFVDAREAIEPSEAEFDRGEPGRPPSQNSCGPVGPDTASNPPGLSKTRVRELAAEYLEGANAQHGTAHGVDQSALDREPRTTLRAEVPPKFVEVEFERVMKVVFAV